MKSEEHKPMSGWQIFGIIVLCLWGLNMLGCMIAMTIPH